MDLQRIIKLFLFTGAILITPSLNAQSGKDLIEYCNDRFDFCMKYPADVFVQKNISTNEDGLVLRSSDDNIRLRVYGYHNVLRNNASAELNNYIEMVEMDHPGMELILLEDKRSSENAFAVMRVGRIFYFVHTIYKGDDMIGLTLEINRKKDHTIGSAKEIAEALIRQISI